MRHALVLACAFGLLSSAAFAKPAACVSEAERQAMAVRAFQSQLMVAAVACNQADAYNTFARRYQTQLTSQGESLKAYFKRAHAGKSEKELNNFITELANAWSQVHLQNMTSYCKATWATMWQLEKHPQSAADFVTTARNQSYIANVVPVLCDGAAVPAASQVAAAPKK